MLVSLAGGAPSPGQLHSTLWRAQQEGRGGNPENTGTWALAGEALIPLHRNSPRKWPKGLDQSPQTRDARMHAHTQGYCLGEVGFCLVYSQLLCLSLCWFGQGEDHPSVDFGDVQSSVFVLHWPGPRDEISASLNSIRKMEEEKGQVTDGILVGRSREGQKK